jgi:hypothetical protein
MSFLYSYLYLLLELVLETSNNSIIERNIYNVLRKHFLEQRPITWKPIKVELIVNTELTDDFFRKYFLLIYYFSDSISRQSIFFK